MRRAFAGLRAARVRPDQGVLITIVAAGVLLLAACGPATGDVASEPPAPVTTATPTTATQTTAAPTTATPAPASSSAGPTPSTTRSPTPTATPKPVVPKPVAPKPVAPKVVVPRPVVPKPAPARTTAPKPPAAPACHPSYAGACLDPDASDYDCAGGSGNGPLYTGTVRVVGPDVFDLDRDGNGIGCD